MAKNPTKSPKDGSDIKAVADAANEFLEYRDGGLYFIKPTRKKKVGERFGANVKGHRYGGVGGFHVREHWLVWLIHYGSAPTTTLDHINGIRDDNRITNLRLANQSQNMQNKSIQSNNTSGHPGVSWCSTRQKWVAHIHWYKKQKNLGRFETKDEAIAAYTAAKAVLHDLEPNVILRKTEY